MSREAIQVPTPRYPYRKDSWRELFKVFDSSQAILARDIDPHSDVIYILPRDLDRGHDIWGENGFVTIGDETVYYDSLHLHAPDSSRTISPYQAKGEVQEYRLSLSRQDLQSKEVLDVTREGVETRIRKPLLLRENLLTTKDVDFPFDEIDNLPDEDYSLVGQVRVSGVWHPFVLQGNGGERNIHLFTNADNPLTSVILSPNGITFYGANIEKGEVTYYSTPLEKELVVPSSLDVLYEGELVIKSGEIVSSEVSEYNLSSEGSLTISWNTTKAREIEVDYFRDRVIELRDCIRGYNTPSFPHRKGSLVCGFVMAEHHNNLSDSIIKTEDYTRFLSETLTELEGLGVEKNSECPNGSFSYEVIEEEDENQGPLVRFTLSSDNANGNRLYFGDGLSERNVDVVDHQYARGAQFAPTAVFYNDLCEEYVSEGDDILADIDLDALNLPIIPAVNLDFGAFEFDFSPIDFPDFLPADFEGVDLGEIGGVPSFISIGPDIFTQIPSTIHFDPISIPTLVDFQYNGPTQIGFGDFSMPTMISIVGMPTEIQLTGISIPTQVVFTGNSVPSQISVSLSIAVDTSAISGNCFKLVPCSV